MNRKIDYIRGGGLLKSRILSSRLNMKYQLKPFEPTLILLFIVLFLPSLITLRNISNPIASTIGSWTWRILFYRDGATLLRLDLSLLNIQYVGLKYLLIFQFYRYFRRSTTMNRVILLAILCELQMFLLLDLPQIIQGLQGLHAWTAFIWYIPIPTTLLFTVILMILVQQSESEPLWIDEEKEKKW